MKTKKPIVILLGLFLIFCAHRVEGKKNVLVIKGGQVHTISSGVIKNGTVLIEGQKIRLVGSTIQIPKGANVIDAKGLIVTPGIIDARTSFGLKNLGGRKEFIQSASSVIDSFKQQENSQWLKGGVTTVYVTPSPTSLLGGFGAVIKLVGGKEKAVILETAGLSLSFGESALQFSSRNKPTTRQGMLGRLRQEFIRAKEYMDQRKNESGSGEEDIQMEALGKVLRREIPLRAVANMPDDIMSALRFANEFNIELVIDLGAGAHEVAGYLAKAKVPVVVGPSIMGLGSGGPLEMYAHTPENAGLLECCRNLRSFGPFRKHRGRKRR